MQLQSEGRASPRSQQHQRRRTAACGDARKWDRREADFYSLRGKHLSLMSDEQNVLPIPVADQHRDNLVEQWVFSLQLIWTRLVHHPAVPRTVVGACGDPPAYRRGIFESWQHNKRYTQTRSALDSLLSLPLSVVLISR